MKKSSSSGASIIILLSLLVIGLLLGGIIGDILGKIGIPYINETQQIRWNPSGDFLIVVWDIDLLIKINLASVIGLALAFWVYRKL